MLGYVKRTPKTRNLGAIEGPPRDFCMSVGHVSTTAWYIICVNSKQDRLKRTNSRAWICQKDPKDPKTLQAPDGPLGSSRGPFEMFVRPSSMVDVFSKNNKNSWAGVDPHKRKQQRAAYKKMHSTQCVSIVCTIMQWVLGFFGNRSLLIKPGPHRLCLY